MNGDASPLVRGAAAAIEVVRAPAYLAVQDLGRRGFRDEGVPPGGAMDPWALARANLLAGNAARAAGLEWALSPGAVALALAAPRRLALAGAGVDATLDGRPLPQGESALARPGARLEVTRFRAGRFLYLAVEGGVDVPEVLGSRATLLAAGIGGFEGRRLRTGDRIPLGAGSSRRHALLRISSGMAATRPESDHAPIRCLPGPHWEDFRAGERARFFATQWRVAAASDRAGYRLEGDSIGAAHGEARGEIASEPCVPGSIEVPASGEPIVLMPDGPTTGGFRQLAVVIAADLARLAQRPPGGAVRFALVDPGAARRALRELAERCGVC